MTTQPRSQIGRLPGYSLAEQSVPGAARIIQLGQNELGVDPSQNAVDAARAAIGQLMRYPGSHDPLRQAIADVHGLERAQVICGAGSMELMVLLNTAYCEPGNDVVVSAYGYKFFQLQAALAGAGIRIAAETDLRVDLENVLAEVSKHTRLVFLVNPNNPTGSLMSAGAVRELREQLPEDVLLVVDEAYAEFAAGRNLESALAMVTAGANVAVLRTFSKAYGLAALRVGWLYGPADVVQTIERVRVPDSVTAPSLAAAEAAVRDRQHIARVVDEVVTLRDGFAREVKALGLEVYPSGGNFVLVRFPADGPGASGVFDGLKQSGIIVRPMVSYALDDCLRITIGSAEEMRTLASELVRLV